MDATAHDLRHAFGTQAANRLPLATSMLLTGHTTTSAFRRYCGHDPNAASTAAGMVGDAYAKMSDLARARRRRAG